MIITDFWWTLHLFEHLLSFRLTFVQSVDSDVMTVKKEKCWWSLSVPELKIKMTKKSVDPLSDWSSLTETSTQPGWLCWEMTWGVSVWNVSSAAVKSGEAASCFNAWEASETNHEPSGYAFISVLYLNTESQVSLLNVSWRVRWCIETKQMSDQLMWNFLLFKMCSQETQRHSTPLTQPPVSFLFQSLQSDYIQY